MPSKPAAPAKPKRRRRAGRRRQSTDTDPTEAKAEALNAEALNRALEAPPVFAAAALRLHHGPVRYEDGDCEKLNPIVDAQHEGARIREALMIALSESTPAKWRRAARELHALLEFIAAAPAVSEALGDAFDRPPRDEWEARIERAAFALRDCEALIGALVDDPKYAPDDGLAHSWGAMAGMPRPVSDAFAPGAPFTPPNAPDAVERGRAQWGKAARRMVDLAAAIPMALVDGADKRAMLTAIAATVPRGADDRVDTRILPAPDAKVIETRPERRRAERLFAFPNEHDAPAAVPLPLWEAPARALRVPLLDVVDFTGAPIMTQGRGAPLVPRLIIHGLLSVAYGDRHAEIVRIPLSLGTLRAALWPNGWQRWRDMPRLFKALRSLDNFGIRYLRNGRPRIWRPAILRDWPDPKTATFDDVVLLDVSLPPGAADGPLIDLPALNALGVESGPRWRAYIAAQTLAWRPGLSRVRGALTGGRHVWSARAAAYPIFTRPDRHALAFGRDDGKHRTVAEIDKAFRDLPGLVLIDEHAVDSRTGAVGWRIVPDEAAAAIARAAARQ